MANNNVFLAETELRVDEASGVANAVIVRTGSLEGSVSITYGVNADTATEGADFIGGFGTATMAPGVASITVPVTVLNDALGEPTETFGFSIVDVAGATLWAPRTMRISILDDETPAPPPPAEPPLISAFNVEQQVLAAGLNTPMKIEFSPLDANLVYIAEKGGVIKLVNITTGETNTVIDFSTKVNDVQDRGLMDIVLDPNFASNRYIYAFYVAEPADTAGKTGLDAPDANGNRYAHVVRMTADAAGTGIIAGSEKILIGGAGQSLADISGLGRDDFTNPAFVNAVSSERYNVGAHGQMVVDGIKQDYIKLDSITHAGGALAFGPDGKLYIAIGDGTAFDFADPRTVDVQSINSLSGKVLRVDPATGQGLTDNPFYDSGMSLDANASKVFQLGLRNPFASAFDAEGRLFLSNTGWFDWEMIQTGGGGANFGWPFFEGADGGVLERANDYQNFSQAAAFYAAVADGSIIVTPPYRAFSHDSNDPGFAVTAITGSSSIYTGNVYPAELKNDYFFQDFADGEIYSVDTQDRTKVQFLYRADGRPIDFVQGPDGHMYYVDIFTNELGRLNITARQTGPAVDLALPPIGSGTDVLTLRITQDEWNGSAQFIVTIDGQQIGGIQTVSAAAEFGSGTVNTLDVLGSFAVGQRTVGVTFLNDGWDGTLANDRNLYVESASYNGVAVGGTTPLLTMLDGSPRFFSVNDTTPVGTTPPPPSGDISLGAIGSGSDTLRLRITQDEWNGNAQFIVTIDGQQIGGIQTVSTAAQRGTGTANTLDVLGSFAVGQHTVGLTLLNDAWDGTLANDRNLYVESANYNGVAISGAQPLLTMLDGSPRFFSVNDTTPVGTTPPPPPSGDIFLGAIGSGSDTLRLRITQDEWNGSAQFTVSIDGQQIGGIQTVSAAAERGSGTANTLDVLGSFAVGQRTVGVTFLNDGWDGTLANDRNLYVESATYDGVAVGGPTPLLTLLDGGPRFFAVNDTTPVGTTPPPPSGGDISLGAIGSGSDTLRLRITQDEWNGSAQFIVTIDGQQIGGAQTVSAAAERGSGTANTLDVLGNFAVGQHTVGVTFLNDAWDGTLANDRNLYVESASYNGVAVGGAAPLLTMLDGSPRFFSVNDTTPVGTTPPPPTGGDIPLAAIGSGSDTLRLRITQDEWNGSAQFTVSIDGRQIGGVQTVSAAAERGSGTANTLDVLGDFAPGQHTVSIGFINDAWDGTAANDRNLYIESATYDGATVGGPLPLLAMLDGGTRSFAVSDFTVIA